MSTIEDQLRAAGRAVTEQVTSLPELRLTAVPRAGRRLPWARGRRRWAAWGAPLTVMGVVVALAVALVTVRGTGRDGAEGAMPSVQGTPPSTAQVPEYYIAASLPTTAIIGDVRTGKEVAVIRPPAGHAIRGVTGSADGSAFVLDMPLKGAPEFFMYRAAKAGGAPLQRSPLYLEPFAGREEILGFALSPGGSRLAVLSVSLDPPNEEFLRVYSVADGKAQGQWTMPAPSTVAGGGSEDNTHALTWTENGQAVAFRRDINLAGGEFGISVFILNVTRPGGDLRADSRIVKVQATDNQCKQMLVTSDGKTVVCGVRSWGGASARCPDVRPGITEYSAVTGKLIRVLYTYKGACQWGMVHIFWSNPSGTAVVASVLVGRDGTHGKQTVNVVGLFGLGAFTELPLRLPGTVSAIMNDLCPAAF